MLTRGWSSVFENIYPGYKSWRHSLSGPWKDMVTLQRLVGEARYFSFCLWEQRDFPCFAPCLSEGSRLAVSPPHVGGENPLFSIPLWWVGTHHSHGKLPSVFFLSPVGLGLGDWHGSMTAIVHLVVSINKKTPLVSDPGASCFFSIHTYKVHHCVSGVTSWALRSSWQNIGERERLNAETGKRVKKDRTRMARQVQNNQKTEFTQCDGNLGTRTF